MFGDHGLVEAVAKNLLKFFTWMGAAVVMYSLYLQDRLIDSTPLKVLMKVSYTTLAVRTFCFH